MADWRYLSTMRSGNDRAQTEMKDEAYSSPVTAPKAERINIPFLDIAVTPLTAWQTAEVVTSSTGRQLLLNHNLHSAYLHEVDDKFRALYSLANWIVIDGTPIRWLASRSSHRIRSAYRTGSTDWIAALPRCQVKRRLFVFGATLESNEAAVGNLRSALPDWTIAGLNGYVSEESALTSIAAFKPDIVLVGLGMPRQERFLLAHLHELPEAMYVTVGGAIDYVAGATRLSPRWLARFGLEWLWRLANQPRRLAYRYLIEPIKLFGLVASRTARIRRAG